jgi:flavin-dependent dehydrogenase
MVRYDVIVVGSRCAGASLALLLARQGYRVLASDRARFPSDTMSTHFLPPRTTAMLASWGLLDRLSATGCPLIETITLDVGPIKIRGRPDAVDGTNAMYCPRRRVLDNLLVTAAREAGAEIREQTTVRELIWNDDRVCGVRTTDTAGVEAVEHAAIVVGADGLWSRVAREVDAQAVDEQASASCGYYTYWANVPTDGVEFYRRENLVVLVFPTHDKLTCIYVGLPYGETARYRADVHSTYINALDYAPALADRVRAGKQVEALKGTNKLPNFFRQSWGRGWALVGDAAYHRDPITGMGIGDALLGAQLLADAIHSAFTKGETFETALPNYQLELRRRTRDLYDYTLRSAQLLDPAPLMPFYEGVSRDEDATRHMMNVLTGASSYRTLFNPANIARISNGITARHTAEASGNYSKMLGREKAIPST